MIYWVGLLSTLMAIESVFIGTCYFLVFPTPQSAVSKDFFTTYQHAIQPKHDVLFLRLFILIGVGSFIALMRYLKTRTSLQQAFWKKFTVLEAMVIAVQTFFLFKYAIYRYPLWQYGFYAAVAAGILIKIFTPEVFKCAKNFNARLKEKVFFPQMSFWLTLSGMVLIPLIIWVPDVEGAVARMFFGEHFHHMDWLLMSAGWAHMSGNILDVDNISRYGSGAPILVSELARHVLGRFDYVNAVIVMMSISIVYYWIWFLALRVVLKDTAWAVIAIFLGLRLHFFNVETFPFIFTYPQDTPIRFFGDALFFLFLILHLRWGAMRWLYAASAAAGFYVFYITGEGIYTLVTFYIFLVMREAFLYLNPAGGPLKRLNLRQAAIAVLLPWPVLFFCFWVTAGGHIFTSLFWYNQFEFIRFYAAGNQTALMLNNLTAPFVDRAAIAFLMPVLYMLALVYFVGQMLSRSLKTDGLIMACACFFLLISYHYHATLANNMPSYLRNGVPIAMLCIYAAKTFSAGLSLYHQRLCKVLCAAAVGVMMVTTDQFLLHPNIFNCSRNPMTHPVVSEVPVGRKSYFSHLFISYPNAFKLPINGLGQKEEMLVTEQDFADDQQMKELFRKESDYTQDAALIRSLTSADEKVPLVSSFETLILMQALRRPFFYTFFMVNSQPRRMRKFPVTILFTHSNLQREIERLERLKPTYIFVERTYLVSPFPEAYLYDNEDLVALLTYIFSQYTPYKAGEFLEALKHR